MHGGAQGQHAVGQGEVRLAQGIAPVQQSLVSGLGVGDVSAAIKAGFSVEDAGGLVVGFLGFGQLGIEIGQGLDQGVDVDAIALGFGDQLLGLGGYLGGTRQVQLLALQDVLFALLSQ